MEFEFIKEKVNLDPVKRGTFAPIIDEWLASENKTIKFKCKNTKEAKNVYSCAFAYKKKRKLDYTIITRYNLCEVYLVRA